MKASEEISDGLVVILIVPLQVVTSTPSSAARLMVIVLTSYREHLCYEQQLGYRAVRSYKLFFVVFKVTVMGVIMIHVIGISIFPVAVVSWTATARGA